jgi:hypothetical protein
MKNRLKSGTFTFEVEIPLTSGLKRFVQADVEVAAGDELAIILPGMRFDADQPLLQEVGEVFARRGIDTMRLRFEYAKDPAFLNASRGEQMLRVAQDGRDIFRYATTMGNYKRYWVIGKSLGTLCMGVALNGEDVPSECVHAVWLTPPFRSKELLNQVTTQKSRSLVIIGSHEASNTHEIKRALKAKPHITMSVVSGVDHGFEHSGDPDATLATIKHTKRLVASWMGRIAKDAVT